MIEADLRRHLWLKRWELPLIVLVAATVFCMIPISLGQIGVSWDMLNHHIYLGWVAEHPRFDRDFLAASYQSYQYPYLYWPVYKLATSGASGTTTGMALALIHALSVPPVWLLARTCIPGDQWFDAGMRAIAVALAFTSGVVLSMFDSTANDLMAATPMVWALAFAFLPMNDQQRRWLSVTGVIILSGFLAGVAVGFKLSNVPLAILLPPIWVLYAGSWRRRAARLVLAGIAAAFGYLLVYGYWGWQLWLQFGNPIYPFFDPLFAHIREVAGWAR